MVHSCHRKDTKDLSFHLTLHKTYSVNGNNQKQKNDEKVPKRNKKKKIKKKKFQMLSVKAGHLLLISNW